MPGSFAARREPRPRIMQAAAASRSPNISSAPSRIAVIAAVLPEIAHFVVFCYVKVLHICTFFLLFQDEDILTFKAKFKRTFGCVKQIPEQCEAKMF